MTGITIDICRTIIVRYMYKKSFSFMVALSCLLGCCTLYSQVTAPNTFEFSSLFAPAAKYVKEGSTIPDTEKSSQLRFSLGYAIPLSVNVDSLSGKVNSWTASLNASYSVFDEPFSAASDFPDQLFYSELGILHYASRTNNWAFLQTASLGINTDFGNIDYHDLAVNAGVLFLKTYNPKLTVGFGVFAFNAISTPLVLPGIVVNWQTAGRYRLTVNLPTEISIAFNRNERNEIRLAFRPKNINYDITNKTSPHERSLSYWELPIGLENKFRGRQFDITIAGGLMALRSFQLYQRGISNMFQTVPAQMMGSTFFINAGLCYHI